MHFDKLKKLARLRMKGNIALTAVLLAGAILITSGIAVLFNAIDVTITSKNFVSRQFSELKIDSCVEESMRKLVQNSAYTGTISVTFPDGSCQSVITNVGGDPTKKNLAISATVSGYTTTRIKKVNTGVSPFALTN